MPTEKEIEAYLEHAKTATTNYRSLLGSGLMRAPTIMMGWMTTFNELAAGMEDAADPYRKRMVDFIANTPKNKRDERHDEFVAMVDELMDLREKTLGARQPTRLAFPWLTGGPLR